MDTNNINQVTSFYKLRNDKGEDVYTLDKFGESFIVSPLMKSINIFDTLTLYKPEMESETDVSCKINMSEVFINALYDVLERNGLYGDAKIFDKMLEDKTTNTEADPQGVYNYFNKSKIIFREINECFPNNKSYEPPNAVNVTNELTELDQLLGTAKRVESKPYVRETPKVGANDPCPCGSGKKYKQCCRA